MTASKEEDVSFPRGCGASFKSLTSQTSAQTPSQKRKRTIEKEDDSEDLFKAASKSNSTPSKKKKTKKSSASNQENDSIEDIPKAALELNYKDIREGMKLLSCINRVRTYDLQISLPGGCVASIPITKISRPYTKALEKVAKNDGGEEENDCILPLDVMFETGTLLPVRITEVIQDSESGFYDVKASCCPSLVQGEDVSSTSLKEGTRLMCAVVSQEDHGYIMDAGIPGVTAFMTAKKAAAFKKARFSEDRNFGIGELVPCLVTRSDSGTVALSANPLKVNEVVKYKTSPAIRDFVPGMSFDARLKSSFKNGIKVTFCNNFEGIIPTSQIGDEEPTDECIARILYVLPTINVIVMTLKSNFAFSGLLALPEEGPRPGDLITSAIVLKYTSKGLILEKNSFQITVTNHHLGLFKKGLESPEEVRTKYSKGKKVSVKILSYDFMTFNFIGTMRKELLSGDIAASYSSLKPGVFVKGTLKKFVQSGVLIKLNEKLTGFIPYAHLSDVPLKKPEAKFSIGDILRCRVLRLEPENRKCHLTAKKILVNEEFPVISSYDSENLGVITEGVVAIVRDKGILLELFGGVKGWVPKKNMSTEFIEYPKKLFYPGQILKTKIIATNPQKENMILSLILSDHKPLGSKEKQKGSLFKIGEKYDGVVSEVGSDGLEVTVNEIKTFIPKQHLTDHPCLIESLLKSYSSGESIVGALCFEKDVVPILSLKPSLLNYSGPMRFEELVPDMLIPGVVSYLKSYGAFVKIPSVDFNRKALIPAKNLADYYIEDVPSFLEINQTIIGKIVSKEEDKSGKSKLTLTSKLKDLNQKQFDLTFMKSFDNDMRKIRETYTSSKVRGYLEGVVLSVTVLDASESFGVFVTVGESSVKGIITASNMDSGLKTGDKIFAAVLYVDFENEILEMTSKASILSILGCKKKAKKNILRNDYRVDAIPIWSKMDYPYVLMAVVEPAKFKGIVVKVQTKKHMNDFVGIGEDLNASNTYKIIITDRLSCLGILPPSSLEKKEPKKESPVVKKRKTSIDDKTEESPIKKVKAQNDVQRAPQNIDDEEYNPWGSGSLLPTDSMDIEDQNEKTKKIKTHLSKTEKKTLDELEEKEILEAEKNVRDGIENEPTSVSEFEKSVLTSPDSSLMWVKYAAFHVESGAHDEARSVIKRALEKINFRKEEERFNVYIAWFNLENSIGTSDEKIAELVKEILRANNDYKAYDKMSDIYFKSGRIEKAQETLQMMVRKFKKEPSAWAKLGKHYFQQKDLKEARFTLQRAIQSCEKKDHVHVTSLFGQMEFKYGEEERGKTIFETIIGNYPRRIDLWNVYADLLVKANQIEVARDLYERMITLNLAPKKMKGLFKKYMDFETSHGDEFKADRVKKKAIDYVQGKLGTAETFDV